MTSSCTDPARDDPLQPCGCCEARVDPTPAVIFNPPGLPAIRYRVGDYARFRQAMLEGIARKPELAGWTSREDDDYGVALLDMWAYIADILTFYQERIANEAFIRTAVLPESVRRLAAFIGYRPAPGAAAETWLAFTLEKGKSLTLPAGLRIQSVPEAGEQPQKFETLETVQAHARLNRVAILPPLRRIHQLDRGATRALLAPNQAKALTEAIAPGDQLVLFGEKPGSVEIKTAREATTQAGFDAIAWEPGLTASRPLAATRWFKLLGRYRLFGGNAPVRVMEAIPDSTQPAGVRWTYTTRTAAVFRTRPGLRLQLDATYPDLKAGMKVLIAAPGQKPILAEIARVTSVQAAFHPQTATVTQLTLDRVLPALDRRSAQVYALGQEIVLWPYAVDARIAGNAVWVRARGLHSGDLARDRRLILADSQGRVHAAAITATRSVQAGSDTFLSVEFTPALKTPLQTETAFCYGNVAKAGHGETVRNERLGDGDAAAAFQRFTLKKTPVTYVPHAGAPHGVASTLEVRVDGVRWREVPYFYGRQPHERIFITRVDEEGKRVVQFGDGRRGARLTTGRGNVIAAYRQGLGLAGNVKAGQLKRLLDKPAGLNDAINPLPASGGADPESMTKARLNAPNSVRTLGRIVSLRDFEDAAREHSLAAKARASLVWMGEEQAVLLVVAGPKGAFIEPGSAAFAALKADLDSRRDPNRMLIIRPHRTRPLQIAATIYVQRDRQGEAVQKEVERALLAYFAFDNQPLGRPIHLSDIYAVIHGVEGVAGAHITRLRFAPPVLAPAPSLAQTAARVADVLLYWRRRGQTFAVEELVDMAVLAERVGAAEPLAVAHAIRTALQARIDPGLFALPLFRSDASEPQAHRRLRLAPDELAVLAKKDIDLQWSPAS